jgi:pilus assembly protein Flp/PilA
MPFMLVGVSGDESPISAFDRPERLSRGGNAASAAGYALILAIVGTAIALAAVGLGTAISGSMNNASSDCISTASSCT